MLIAHQTFGHQFQVLPPTPAKGKGSSHGERDQRMRRLGRTNLDGECGPDDVLDLQRPHSWAAQIWRCSKYGHGRKALKLYEEMRKSEVEPGQQTFVALLKACSSLQDLESARQIHAEVVRSGFETDLHVGTMLVDAYANCGSVKNAKRVFEEMPHRDVVCWNAMILGYGKRQKGEEALQLYSRMRLEGVVPNDRTIVGALKACSCIAESEQRNGHLGSPGGKQCLDSVRAIHADARKVKVESSVFVESMLVDAYAKCGSLDDAKWVFESMSTHDVVSWTAIILGHARREKGEEALKLYQRMRVDGVQPNDRTYVAVLKACSALAETGGISGADIILVREQCLKVVRAIHADAGEKNSVLNVFVANMLLDAYGKCGSLENARRVFDTMPVRTMASWNSMILGYAQMGMGDVALKLYMLIQVEGVVPDNRTYVGALKACCAIAESTGGSCGVGMQECLKTVKAIHADVRKRKFELDVFVRTMLIDAYAKCGSLENARKVFDEMPVHNVVSWTVMISGYVHMEQGAEALILYAHMQEKGLVPNERTYLSALKACSSVAETERNGTEGVSGTGTCLEIVTTIHSDLRRGKFELNAFVGAMLVDAYAKCGSVESARHVFENLASRDLVVWNSMILGYTQTAKGEEALELYKRMIQEGVVPNDRTYVGALKACITIVEVGDENGSDQRKHCLGTVRAIQRDVGKGLLQSNVFVGNMLVDALAKCGSLGDARQVFEEMSHRDVISWSCMILGYSQMEKGHEALHLYARMQQEGVVPNERTYVGVLTACGSVAGLNFGKEIHAHIMEAGLQSCSFISISLIDMYGKCSSMVDAQRVFDAMPTKEIVAWNALIAGYAHQGDSEVVFSLLETMQQYGVQPDGITFVAVLLVCSHLGLVESAQENFEAMSRDYDVTPTMQHYSCMIDLLARAGHINEAMQIVQTMPFHPDSATWKCILGACRKWGNVEIGRLAFNLAVMLDRRDAAAYVLMATIYAAAHMLEKAKQIDKMRSDSNAWKEPGRSWWMDNKGRSHVFMVGDQGHSESRDIYAMVENLWVKIKDEGRLPHRPDVAKEEPVSVSGRTVGV